MTYQWVCEKSNTTGATRGVRTAYPSGSSRFFPVFSVVHLVHVVFSSCVVLSTTISVQKLCSSLSFFIRRFMFYHLFVFIYAYSCPTPFPFNTIFVSCNTTGLETQELSTFPEHPNLPSVNSEWFDLIWFIVFNATFSNISAISWRSVSVVEEAAVRGENYRPWASNW